MKAEDAAIYLQARRGYVIVCQLAGLGCELVTSDRLSRFSGGPLQRHMLTVTGKATRADWDTQLRDMDAGGLTYKDFPLPGGEVFFRCRLEALNGCA